MIQDLFIHSLDAPESPAGQDMHVFSCGRKPMQAQGEHTRLDSALQIICKYFPGKELLFVLCAKDKIEIPIIRKNQLKIIAYLLSLS